MELIIVALITTIGMILSIQLLNHNWFKKQVFKFDRDFKKKKSMIDLKKYEKDLGLGKYARKTGDDGAKTGLDSNLAGLLPLLKNLSGDQLEGLIEGLTGGEGESDDNPLGAIIEALPPDVIKTFLDGLKQGQGDKEKENSGNGFI